MMRSAVMGRSLRRALVSINSLLLSRPPPPPSTICSPVCYLSRRGSTTLSPILGFRGDLRSSLPQPLSVRGSSTGRRTRSGTIILCIANSDITAIGADNRLTTTIREGNVTFGDFIDTDDDDKLGTLSDYIVFGVSGDESLSDLHVSALKATVKSSSEVSLKDLHDINEQILSGQKCRKDYSFGMIFADCREVVMKILDLQFDKNGLKQNLYPCCRVVAIGTGISSAMTIAHPFEVSLPEADLTEVKVCIERSILKAIMDEPSCGGGCRTLTWDSKSEIWEGQKKTTNQLMSVHSKFLDTKELPFMLTADEAERIISQWSNDILTGCIPQELEAFEIQDTDDERTEKAEGGARKHVEEFSQAKPSDTNAKKLVTESVERTDEKENFISRLDIRIGLIKKVHNYTDAISPCILEIETGDETSRTVLSNAAKSICLEEMQYCKVCVLCNTKPVTMDGIIADAILLTVYSEDFQQS